MTPIQAVGVSHHARGDYPADKIKLYMFQMWGRSLLTTGESAEFRLPHNLHFTEGVFDPMGSGQHNTKHQTVTSPRGLNDRHRPPPSTNPQVLGCTNIYNPPPNPLPVALVGQKQVHQRDSPPTPAPSLHFT